MKPSSSPYVLSKGKKAQERLDFQHMLFREKMLEAFRTVSGLRDLIGARVLDFGCGTSSAYKDIRRLIGPSGIYVGVDLSRKQIALNQSQIKEAVYLIGNESSPSVLSHIASADIIYLRFVVMHQKKPKDFLFSLYKEAHSKAIFIIQEPENTPELKEKMVEKYPFAGDLCDLKVKAGKKIGLDYNFAKYIAPLFHELGPKTLIHTTEPLEISLPHFKKFISASAKEMNRTNPSALTNKELKHYLDILSKLPEDENLFLSLDSVHTFIVQKS